MRRVDQLFQNLVVILFHAEFVDAEDLALAAEQAEDEGLPVGAGEGGDAEIDLLAADPARHAPVLRQAAFGDVEAGEEFQARGDRVEAGARLNRTDTEDAVDAEAHDELALLGLDVDVGGAGAGGFADDAVDIGDGGSVLGEVSEGTHAGAIMGDLLAEALDQAVDQAGAGQRHLEAGEAAAAFEGFLQQRAERIAGAAVEVASFAAPDDGGAFDQPIEGDAALAGAVHHLLRRRQRFAVEDGEAVQLAEHGEQVGFIQHALADQNVAEPLLQLALGGQGALDFLGRHQPFGEERFFQHGGGTRRCEHRCGLGAATGWTFRFHAHYLPAAT